MIGVTWIGHSSVLIDLDGVQLLTDPLLRNRVIHLRRVVDVPHGAGSDADAILISTSITTISTFRRSAGSTGRASSSFRAERARS